MEEVQEISGSLFDYKEFEQNSYLSDCNLIIKVPDGEEKTIPAHKLVLANASGYFYDAFTSGMEEQITNKVEIRLDSKNDIEPFYRILKWMYTGQFQFPPEELISILQLSRLLRVQALEEELKQYLSETVNKTNVINLVDKCYELNLSPVLRLLEPYLVKFFEEIDMQVLSEKLDVSTFCSVIKEKNYTVEVLIQRINEFMSNYSPNEDEKKCLAETFPNFNQDVRDLIKKYDVKWLPADILRAANK